jgi:hypothetical protein
MSTFGKGLCALAAVCTAVAANAAGNAGLTAGLHLSDARGPIRAVDLTPFASDVSSEILAGPGNGLDSAFVIYTRLKAGAKPKGLYTLPVDHTYLVLAVVWAEAL